MLHDRPSGGTVTGIDLYINTRRVGKRAVRSVESLSGGNKGREMAIHIKTRIYDIMFCAFCLPPGERKKDTDDIIEWVSERVDKCGHRCLPLLCCDANAHVGFSRVPGVAAADVRTAFAAIGGHNPARENYQGYALRHFPERRFLALSNTFFWNTPTFYGVTGNTRIDYILCPRAFLPHVTSRKVWRKAGETLQIIQTNQRRDHRPVVLTIRTRLAYEGAPCAQRHLWDQDKIFAAATQGINRNAFINDMESELQRRISDNTSLLDVDVVFEWLHSSM